MLFTVAIPVLLLLQLPPVVPSVKAVVDPVETVAMPVITDGEGLTVTTCVDAAVPQLLDTV